MVNNICAVSGCGKESYPGCGLSFHSLPSDLELKKKWFEVIPGNLGDSSVVCTLHFKPEDYRTEARKRLKPGVIPSIFPKILKNNLLFCKKCQIVNKWQPHRFDPPDHSETVQSLAQTQSTCPGRSSRKCDPEPTIGTANDNVSTDDEVDHDEVGDNEDNGSVGSDDVIDINAEDSNSDDIEYVNKTEPTDSLIHAAFRCNVCCGEIKGFRYVCVQCTDWDMCAACEARGEHPTHYVLRLPAPKPNIETEPVLVAIREYIQGLLNLKNEAHEVYFKEEVLDEHLDEEETGSETESADSFSCISDRSVPDVNINKIDSNENETDSLHAVDIQQSAPEERSEMCALKTNLVSYSISNKNIVITPAHMDEGSSLHMDEDSFLNMNEETDPTTVTRSEVHKPLTVQKPLGNNNKLLIKKKQVGPKKVVVNQSTCKRSTTEIPIHIIFKPKSESTSIPKGRLLLRQSEVQRPISVSSTQPDREVIQIALSDRKITLLGKRKIAPNKP